MTDTGPDSAQEKLKWEALLFSNLYDAVLFTDARGLIRDCNPAAERLFGYTAAELIGRHPEFLNPASEARQLTESIRRAVAERRPWSGEVRFREKSGREGDCEARVTPLYDEQGNWMGCVCVNRDITESRQAARAIAERSMHSALAADVGMALTTSETLPVAMQRCAEALVRHLDAAFARVWTYNPAAEVLELQGSAGMYTHLDGPHSRIPLGKLKIGWIAQQRRAHFSNAVVGDSQIDDQDWARREGMVAFAGHPLVIGERLVGVAAVFARHPFSEVTLAALDTVADALALGIERERTQEARRKTERMLQDILDNSPAIIYLKDIEGRYLLINRRFEGLFHVTRQGLLGKTDHHVFPSEVAELFRANDLKVLQTGKPLELEEVAPHDDGPHTYISIKFPMFDDAGRAYGVCGISTDITERKRAEQREHQHHVELAHASRLGVMGQMVAQVVHELAQPLEAICRYASAGLKLARSRGVTEADVLRALEELIRVAERANQSIVCIREFLRRTPPRQEPVDMGAAAREALSFIQPEALRRGVKVHLDAEGDLPPVSGDRIQIQQVLLNLALNGIQAMSPQPAGGPRQLLIELRRSSDACLEVSVRDSGAGVSADAAARLFEPFFTTKPDGLGMGLSICHSIVQNLGGRIRFEPREGGGAVFRFTVPIWPGAKK